MQAHVPWILPYQGRQILYSGVGRTPGSLMYLDATTGRTLELFYGQIEQTGPVFCLAVVAGNQAVGRVRVDNTLLNGHQAPVGSLLWLGLLAYLPTGPKAQAAWPARLVPNGQAIHGGRKTGVLTYVAMSGTWGKLIGEQDGKEVFVHFTQLRRGTTLTVGRQVSYVEAQSDRGPQAWDVWPA